MKKFVLLSILALIVVSAHSSAQSGFIVRARMSGLQEVPALSTAARGEFVARVFDNRIVYRMSFSDLGTNSLFAHIHFGATATNGGVAAFLCGGNTKPDPCPLRGGEVTGTIVDDDVIGPVGQGIAPTEFSEFVRAIRSGTAYANIHTTQFTGGEIRGQLTVETDED
jgi:hypothetical protein